MIEIGRVKGYSLVTHRLASAFGAMAAVLLVVWLVRSPLSLSGYSEDILATSFALILLSFALNTRTRTGVGQAFSSFFGNVVAGCVVVIILTLFLGWVDTVPTAISGRLTSLVLAAIIASLLGLAAHIVAPVRYDLHATKPAIFVGASSDVVAGKVKLSPKSDSIAVPISKSGKTVGCMLYGDVRASFDTPMGPVSAPLGGPLTTIGIPFKGDRASDAEVTKLTGETVEQLIQKAQVDHVSKSGEAWSSIDLPFVHLDEDESGEQQVVVGPLRVRKGQDGSSVRVGSFDLSSDDDDEHHRRHQMTSWLARGVNDSSYLRVSGSTVSARWNGSSILMKGDTMKLTIGSDGFFYSPTEVRTFSPLHTLHIGREKMTLDTHKFTLNVSDDLVVFRTENGSKRSTDSPTLARDLRSVFGDEAKKHIQDVVKGVPIDLDEMLSSTEEVLRKYG